MKVALVGATGLVGGIMLKVLEEENFPVSELYPVASEKSVGKTVEFKGKQITIISVEEAISKRPDIALFSAGGTTSLELAPKFAEIGTVVIDNSSAWRMDPTKKLIVPEINGNTITPEDKIIANPNCSTIQMVMALAPLHKKYTIKRLVVSTYQSVTGTGQKAVAQLTNERKGIEGEMAYKYPIDMNCIPHCDVFLDNGYTKEEMKMVHETRKILGDNNIKVTATAVRVPVVGGHSEAINIEFEKPYELNDVFSILKNTQGVEVVDDIENFKYPMPMLAANRNEVLVGRIRRDDSLENGLNMWVVADNLRKGAATNALQIAQLVAQMKSAVN
jgi:aspartate-semialdehyde dehydrogenase